MTLTTSLATAEATYKARTERAMGQLRAGSITLHEALEVFKDARAEQAAAEAAAFGRAFAGIES